MKDLKISKELLNEVIGDIVDIGSYNYPILELNIQHYSFREWTKFNIHEIAHKCKEWAFSQGYSYIGNNKLLNIYREDSQIICIANKDIMNWFDINVDFIACEWILQQKENK